jgi:TonB family protein
MRYGFLALLVLAAPASAQPTRWEQALAAGEKALAAHNYPEAEQHFLNAETIAPDQASLATSLLRLGMVHLQQGGLAPAKRLLERAITIREQGFGPEHPELATVLEHYARLLRMNLFGTEITPEDRDALERYLRLLGENDPRLLEIQNVEARAFAIRAKQIEMLSADLEWEEAGGSYYGGGRPGPKAPQLLHRTDPEFSDEARLVRDHGAAEFRVLIAADGRARNVRLVKSAGLGLDEKALEAVRQWRFRPALLEGEPVPLGALIAVRWTRP